MKLTALYLNNNLDDVLILRHLKLEIALAIPASNDEKYNFSRPNITICKVISTKTYTILIQQLIDFHLHSALQTKE